MPGLRLESHVSNHLTTMALHQGFRGLEGRQPLAANFIETSIGKLLEYQKCNLTHYGFVYSR